MGSFSVDGEVKGKKIPFDISGTEGDGSMDIESSEGITQTDVSATTKGTSGNTSHSNMKDYDGGENPKSEDINAVSKILNDRQSKKKK